MVPFVDLRSGRIPVVLSLFLAHSGCGGGQTGQPGSGPRCDSPEQNRSGCCREPELEDRFGGRTVGEVLAEHAVSRVPLYWAPLSAAESEPRSFEPSDTEEDELEVTLALEEGALVSRCEQELVSIPVAVTLLMDGVYEKHFTASLVSNDGGLSLDVHDHSTFVPEAGASCPISIAFRWCATPRICSRFRRSRSVRGSAGDAGSIVAAA